MPPHSSQWSEERVDTLRRMWADGDSAAIIAAEMGGLTRSAVIGKVHRLGLQPRLTSRQSQSFGAYSLSKPRKAPRARTEPTPPDALQEFNKTETSQLTSEQKAKTVMFMALDKEHCRWPYGSPRAHDFCFCGHQREEGKPYCAPHAAIATYKPAKADTFRPIGEAASAVLERLRKA